MSLRWIHWLVASLVLANLLLFLWPESETRQQERPGQGDVPRLLLLHEVAAFADIEDAVSSVPETSTIDSEVAQATEAPAATLQQMLCWSLGPAQPATIESLTQSLQQLGLQVSTENRVVMVPKDYWVYVPTDGTREQVRFIGRSLREQGIDNYPINDGELQGSLSLGLFRSRERADAVVSDAVNEGFSANVYQRMQSIEEPWFLLRGVDADIEPSLRQLGSELQLESTDCES